MKENLIILPTHQMRKVTALTRAGTMCTLLFATLVTTQAIAGTQANQPNVSLLVNYNSGDTYPLQALVGEQDPNIFVIQGPPNGLYRLELGTGQDGVLVPDVGFSHIRPDLLSRKFKGTLDANGQAQIVVDPGKIPTGASFAAQATVATDTNPKVLQYTGATMIDAIRTMSSPILLRPAITSVANILGPVTDVDLVNNVVSVGDIPFNITIDTVMENFNVLADVAIGEWLAVEGEFAAVGKNANVLVIEDPGPAARLTGRVQGLGPSGFAILDGSIYVNSTTVYTDDTTGLPLVYGDITEGMPVEVLLPAGTSFPYASEVHIDVEIEFEPEPEPELEPEDLPPPPICS